MVIQYFAWNYFTHYRNYKQQERKKAPTSLTCDTGIRQRIVYHVFLKKMAHFTTVIPIFIHKILYLFLLFFLHTWQWWFTYSAEPAGQSQHQYYHSCNCLGHSPATFPAVDNQHMSHLFQPEHRQKKVRFLTTAQNLQSYSAAVHSHATTSNTMNISYFLKLPVTRHLINPLASHS